MNPSSPFPHQGEIIRYLAVAMDLKAGNKDTHFTRAEYLVTSIEIQLRQNSLW